MSLYEGCFSNDKKNANLLHIQSLFCHIAIDLSLISHNSLKIITKYRIKNNLSTISVLSKASNLLIRFDSTYDLTQSKQEKRHPITTAKQQTNLQ